MNKLMSVISLLLIAATAFGATDPCPSPKLPLKAPPQYSKANQPKDSADLPSVVASVMAALTCYQNLAAGESGLPKLTSAVFDFKVTTGKSGGPSLSLWIFKVGATHEKDTTTEISYTYAVPKAATARPFGFAKPQPRDLYKALVDYLQTAGATAKQNATALGLPLSKVVLTVGFGVKDDFQGGINVPVPLVTIGASGDMNKNTTQTVTLNFGQ